MVSSTTEGERLKQKNATDFNIKGESLGFWGA